MTDPSVDGVAPHTSPPDGTPLLRVLLGPTASGKERIAVECARQLNAELISVDSMKIYRQLDIGTAKPDASQRQAVPHHALDFVAPQSTFSVADYVSVAEAAIEKIASRGRSIILSGGTALYYKALLEGLFDGPPADPAVRSALRAKAEAVGPAALHDELASVDSATAARVHPNDVRRVVRALEVFRTTGKPMSQHQVQWSDAAGADRMQSRFRCRMVGLAWPRPMLHQRIAERVGRMMAAGLEDEARWVYLNRESLSRTPLQAVAYKEFFPFFEGAVSLSDAVERLVQNSRQLAKSQMTWFRKFPVQWIEMAEQDVAATAGAVLRAWEGQEVE